MTGLHFHPLRVRQVRPEAEDALVLSFDVPDALAEQFRFRPGQYLTLRQVLGGEDLRRSYSICASPAEGELRVGVRRVAGGRFSTWLHDHLRAGDTIEVMPPQGRFTLPDAGTGTGTGTGATTDATPPGRHVLAIAGGSGITPILSILRTVLEQEPASRVTLLYGNRRIASTLFKEELEDLKNRHLTRFVLHPVFSQEQVDSPLGQGRLDAARLAEFFSRLVPLQGVDQAFVCGPHAMNDEAEAALLAGGLPRDRVHVERFGVPPASGTTGGAAAAAAPASRPGDAAACSLHILRDGLLRVIPWQDGDGSVLDAAARAGMDVPYSCKSGVCGTCRAHVGEGQVRMDRNFALELAELAAGFVLTCQAHPLTPVLKVSFDER